MLRHAGVATWALQRGDATLDLLPIPHLTLQIPKNVKQRIRVQGQRSLKPSSVQAVADAAARVQLSCSKPVLAQAFTSELASLQKHTIPRCIISFNSSDNLTNFHPTDDPFVPVSAVQLQPCNQEACAHIRCGRTEQQNVGKCCDAAHQSAEGLHHW